MNPPERTYNEAKIREDIDQQLVNAGWVIQDKKQLNLYESLGVAFREMDTDTGPADYMLFIAGKACGIIEAKREGTDLGGVAEQSGRYAKSHTKHIALMDPLFQKRFQSFKVGVGVQHLRVGDLEKSVIGLPCRKRLLE